MNKRQKFVGVFLLAGALVASACGSDGGTSKAPTATNGAGTDVTPGGGTTAASTDTTAAATDATTPVSLAARGQLVVAAGGEPETLDPQLKDDNAQYPVTWRVYEGLVDFDADGKLIPLLASDIPAQIDSLTWRVSLRKGVTFTDGTPFDADAVVASIARIINPDYGSVYNESKTIASATKIDDSTVEIKTTTPDTLLSYKLRVIKMMSPKLAAAPKEEAAGRTVGTGPFTVRTWDRGSRVVLESNDDYWGGPPPWSEVEVRFMADPATRVSALQAGDVDVVIALPPEQADQVPGVAITPNGVTTSFVRPDIKDPKLSDVRVRQALNYAIDKEAIAKELFLGYADVAKCQLTPPQAAGTNPDLSAYPYDPDKARELLTAAGADGESLHVDWTTGVFPKDREVGEAVAAYWEAVGLHIDIVFDEYATFLEKINAGFTDDNAVVPAMIFSETANALNHAARQINLFYSGNTHPAYRGEPIMTGMVAKALEETDPAKQVQLLQDVAKYACDQASMIFLVHRRDLIGLGEGISYSPLPDLAVKMYYDKVSPG